MGGRAAAEAAIERARLAGFSALVVTIDTAVSGIRERDHRNGMKELVSGSVIEKLRFLPQILARPGWLASFLLDGGLPALPNVVIPGRGPVPGITTLGSAGRPPSSRKLASQPGRARIWGRNRSFSMTLPLTSSFIPLR